MAMGAAAMRRLGAAAPFLLLAALLSTCGGDAKPSPTPALFPGETWSLEYTKSGSIAGINQRLSLDSKGTLITEDAGRKRQPRQSYIVPADIWVFRYGIQRSSFQSLKSDQGLPHPDAVLISIKVVADGKTYGATFNTTPQSPEVADLLARLDKLYEEYRP
jgi:hypothetical protein